MKSNELLIHVKTVVKPEVWWWWSLVVSDSLDPIDYSLARLLYPWDSPGKNFGVGCHFFLLGIFLTQESNPHCLYLLHWQVDSLPLHHLGSPSKY